jgi:hypothetical protein
MGVAERGELILPQAGARRQAAEGASSWMLWMPDVEPSLQESGGQILAWSHQ